MVRKTTSSKLKNSKLQNLHKLLQERKRLTKKKTKKGGKNEFKMTRAVREARRRELRDNVNWLDNRELNLKLWKPSKHWRKNRSNLLLVAKEQGYKRPTKIYETVKKGKETPAGPKIDLLLRNCSSNML